eukprot:CAMPEP_0197667092 /NCGR_PEP_ID=MMETSP1338-20131121/65037_1 /TAXON_ID=43686 ORGANISM="Pelagodinium beii, Strain RCC1491" /NCGR_SAMPLE_ID=MMETSP1338 /ASSEMBLY_ACC=CAM_ASM_000754 /LENGTH=293 /DNA_ID=CAMNT_0043246257 /DNA_START=132 /DNA_END=1010 /DNA_ORIENTATION=+
MYVSFVEILGKSVGAFQEAGFSEADAFTLGTIIFFSGLLASSLLEQLAHYTFHRMQLGGKAFENGSATGVMQAHADPDKLLNAIVSEKIEVEQEVPREDSNVLPDPEPPPATSVMEATDDSSPAAPNTEIFKQPNEAPAPEDGPLSGQERLNMLQMAAFSGMAIALHNFPEGLATFTAALADPSFGPPMALAIAIHNIPEGLAVAAPILKATGSRWKAFAWAFLSGLSEPVGALLGWLVLQHVMGPITFAILFGVIGGVMVHICIKKLIPTALRYDPENRYTSYSFCAGMAIM